MSTLMGGVFWIKHRDRKKNKKTDSNEFIFNIKKGKSLTFCETLILLPSFSIK